MNPVKSIQKVVLVAALVLAFGQAQMVWGSNDRGDTSVLPAYQWAGQAALFVSSPAAGIDLPSSFAVVGWAVDPAAGNGSGPGVNLVRVYQGGTCSGTVLGEAAPGVTRSDVSAAFGLDSSYNPSGFNLSLSGLSNGSLTFTVCARSSLTNTFTAQVTRTVTIQSSQARVFVSSPAEGAELAPNFVVEGWAVDLLAGYGNGPGVNLVRVYQGSACGGVVLGEAVPSESRPEAATTFGLDSSYNANGFGISLSGLAVGSLTFTVCARSSLTNTFTAQMTRTVTIQNAQTIVWVDSPSEGVTVPGSFAVTGWAVDPGAGNGNGPGVNLVRVYQGAACTGTLLGEVVPNVSRPDVAAAFGLDSSYNLNGYNIPLSGLSNGALTFTVCARSSVTNTFTAQVTRSVTVQVSQMVMSLDSPAEGASFSGPILVSGWAVDLAAGNGNGDGVNLVRVFEGTACSGTVLGNATLNVSRPDVAAAFGLDSSYNLSGFGIVLNGTLGSTFTFTVCARSTITNTFAAQVTRSVTVQAAIMALNDPKDGERLTSSSVWVTGWAVLPSAGVGNGPGINLIRVYQGSSCSGTILGQGPPTISQPAIPQTFGLDSSYNNNAFQFYLTNAPVGTLTFTVCARSSVTNAFVGQLTRTIHIEQGYMDLNSPVHLATYYTNSLDVTGWAYRVAGAGNGPGINLVRVYHGGICGGTILGESVLNIQRPDVVNAYGLDNSYLVSGFDMHLTNLPTGAVAITICGRSDDTGAWVVRGTRVLNIYPTYMTVEAPVEEVTLSTNSPLVTGWTVSLVGNSSGPGINLVRVYRGSSCSGTLLWEGVLTVSRPDIVDLLSLDLSYTVSGFSIPLSNLPTGAYTFTVCGRNRYTGAWAAQVTRTVYSPLYMAVDLPGAGTTVSDSFNVTGWAVHPAAGNGNGPGIDLIRVYEGSACTGTILNATAPSITRLDVSTALSLDSSYNVNGYLIPVTASANGTFTFTVCAHSTVSNTFAAQATRTVTVDSGFAAASGTEARIEAEDEAQMVQMGNWTRHESAVASGEAYLYSSGTGEDSLTLSFTGSQIDIIYVQHPSLGKLAVEIDGVIQQVINLSGIENFGEEMLISDLPAGDHHLRLIALEGIVAVDAVVIPDAAP